MGRKDGDRRVKRAEKGSKEEKTMDFSALKAYVDQLPHVGVPGCDLIVFQDHTPIFHHMAGCRDAAGREPMRGDETYWLYSCTKMITTCAAMQLIGAGKMNLDDPVSAYLPAYAHLTVKEGTSVRPAKRVMTIRHLMSMQSGLSYELIRPAVTETVRRTDGKASTREIVDALAGEPLEFEPGTDFLYSLSHDVLAAVIEVVSGQRFSAYLRDHLFAPLGLEAFTFAPGERELKNFCAAWTETDGKRVPNGPDGNNYRLSENYESGGAGLMGDVKSFITFLDAMACGGSAPDGTVLLPPEMIQLWRANQLGPKSRKTFDAWNRLGYSYALGVRTRVTLAVGTGGALGEFGWDGAAGAWGMMDAERHLSAYFGMHVRNFGYSYDVIHPTIRSLIYEGLGK